MNFPKIAPVQQKFDTTQIQDIAGTIQRELQKIGLTELVRPGMKIGIGVGSRGIHAIAEMVTAVVAAVKAAGGEPVIIPAMGSHGGATAEGQIEVLKTLGVTEEAAGAQVHASMRVEMLGTTANGAPVFFDKNALQCDGILVVNRVKVHTDFHGQFESGLMKMLAVGLGKHAGCSTMHQYGLAETIPSAAQVILEKAPVLGGIAIIENALDRPVVIEGVRAEDFVTREPQLLELARTYLPGIPFDALDVLIVHEMGKKISGTGMDTNVLGRIKIWGVPEPERPKIHQVGVLNLRKDSYGNALGIGLADLTTQRLVDQIDFKAMYANVIPTSFLDRGKIPVTLPTDRALVETALKTIGAVQSEDAKIVIIKNTLELEKIYVSEGLLAEVKSNHNLTQLGDFADWPFVGEELHWE